MNFSLCEASISGSKGDLNVQKSIAFLSALFFLATSVTTTFAANESVTGLLVDLACYGQNKANIGNAHKGKGYICGQACAREGFPVGVLANDGKVYQIAGDLAANHNSKLVPHIAETVTITGDISEKAGITVITANDLKVVNK